MAGLTSPINSVAPEFLRERLIYDPSTGALTWKAKEVPAGGGCVAGRIKTWNSQYAGKPAFTYANSSGYRRGQVGDRPLLAHRVAWAIYYGVWPKDLLDHVNGNPSDNRIENLREVTSAGNARNARISARNRSGFVGVQRSGSGKWYAVISSDDGFQYLGSFSEKSDAAAARKVAERQYGYHPNHGRAA